jgi:hypothetical protein
MRTSFTSPRPWRPSRLGASLARGLLAAVAWQLGPCAVLAATPTQATFIEVLFGDLPPSPGDDANGDGALTVADLLLLPPGDSTTPTPRATGTVTATPPPGATATLPASPTATRTAPPSPTHTDTPAPTATATLTNTPAPTATATPTETPVGLLFAGTISDLLPHAVGDQLVYLVTDPGGKKTTETTTVVSSEADGKFVVDDKEMSGNQVRKHETQALTDTGSELFFTGGTYLQSGIGVSQTCESGLLRLEMPVIAGQTRSSSSRCDVRRISDGVKIGFVDRTDTFTPVSVLPSVTVPAGTFAQVVHFTGTTSLSGDVETNEVDLAPGVGPIRRLSTFGGKTTRLELTGGTIGGVPVSP